MKYFAGNGTVSTDPISGGIEITKSQYGDAIQAMIAGQQIAIVDGEFVIRDPAPTSEHIWDNGEWVGPGPVEPGPHSEAELWTTLRTERDRLLEETDKLMLRHADEIALDLTPTLSAQQYADLLVYRQALRDLPESTEDPARTEWPSPPQV